MQSCIQHKVTDIKVLEGFQKTFTSRIWGLKNLDYWQRLKAFKLMSLQRQKERYMFIHMLEILNGGLPNDIDIKFCDPSRKGVIAKVPSLCKSSSLRNQLMYNHSVIVYGVVRAKISCIQTQLQSKVLVSGIQYQIICTS